MTVWTDRFDARGGVPCMSGQAANSGPKISADDRFAIEQVLSSYGVHHDERDFESLEQCFTADASYTMQVAGSDSVIARVGRTEIVDQIRLFKSRQNDQRRHVITNFLVE